MHKLIFKEVSFRNFMSYGANLNKFTFSDGLTWVHGDNGFGKSTIVEAMTFALLGKSYRGGTKEDLRNSKNYNPKRPGEAPPTVVELLFDISNPPAEDEHYRITRTISGAKSDIKFTLEKYEGAEWIVQNKRAGFTQKDFEENILRFNDVLFKNVIAMNTQETQPFFMLPAAKKRELLESIISLSLDKWKKANNKRASEAQLEFSISESDISQLTNEINELSAIHDKMKREQVHNLQQMKDNATQMDSDIKVKKGQLDEVGKAVTKLRTKMKSISAKLGEERNIDRRIGELSQDITAFSLLDEAKKNTEEKKAALAELSKSLDPMFKRRETLNNDRANAKGELTKLTKDLRDKERVRDDCSVTLRLKSAERDAVTNDAQKFVAGQPCPTCGHVTTEEDVKEHKEVLRVKWKSLNQEVKELKSSLDVYDKEVSDLEEKVAAKTEEIDKIDAEVRHINDVDNTKFKPMQAQFNAALMTETKYQEQIDGRDAGEIAKELDALKKQKETFPAIREEYSSVSEELNEEVSKYSTIDGEIRQLEVALNKLTADIERAESADDNSIAVMEQKIKKNKEMLVAAEKRRSEASDTLALCNAITKICADDGMKQMVFGQFVPVFNQTVARNMAKAGLPFSLKFDDSMSYKFETMPGLSPNYTMLSQGQKRRMGFIVSMAFRDFVSLVGDFNVNFLSLDEVLDISTDDSAMRDMLDLAKLMMADIGCAVVITHRGKVVADKFDYELEVSYNGMYSRLGEPKPVRNKVA